MTQGLELQRAIVAEARTWIGTPLLFGQAVKGLGCDCKGLVAGVARELDLPEAASAQALARDYRSVDPHRLKAGLRELFDPASSIEAGDVLLLTMAGKAQHLAIATGVGKLIHCTGRMRPRCVAEQPLGVLDLFPIDSIWRWRAAVTA